MQCNKVCTSTTAEKEQEMLQYTTDKRSLSKSIALCVVLFFVSLSAMEPTEPITKKKKPSLLQRLKRFGELPLLINCGLTDQLIPQEVMRLISLKLTLQDLGRLNCVKKNSYWDVEHICPEFNSQNICDTVACKRLKECIYNTRTKVLGHYAQTGNIEMFQHIRGFDGATKKIFFGKKHPVRDIDSLLILKIDPSAFLEKYMRKYDKYYGNTKKIYNVYCKYFVRLVCFYKDSPAGKEGKNLLKTILPGTGFNFYLSSYRKKRAPFHDWYRIKTILKETSAMDDTDLLLAAIGGSVQPYMFKSIYKYLSWPMIKDLQKKNLISRGIDKHSKDAAYYWSCKKDTYNLYE